MRSRHLASSHYRSLLYVAQRSQFLQGAAHQSNRDRRFDLTDLATASLERPRTPTLVSLSARSIGLPSTWSAAEEGTSWQSLARLTASVFFARQISILCSTKLTDIPVLPARRDPPSGGDRTFQRILSILNISGVFRRMIVASQYDVRSMPRCPRASGLVATGTRQCRRCRRCHRSPI